MAESNNRVLTHASQALHVLSTGVTLTAPELAQTLGIPRPSGYRLQSALVEAGFADDVPDGGIRISTRWLELGDRALAAISARYRADDLMADLRAKTDLTVFLCVFRDERAVCIKQLHGENFQVLALKIGGELPPYLGAVGRVLLAHAVDDLDSVLSAAPFEPLTPFTMTDADALRADVQLTRERGYCVSDQDVTIGVAAVGVPVLVDGGRAVAALSAAGLREQVLADEARLVELLRETAGQRSGGPGRLRRASTRQDRRRVKGSPLVSRLEPTTAPTWVDDTARAAHGSVPVRVFSPSGPARTGLVWAHGGSWVGGSAEQWHLPCADLAALSSCVVVSVDYRLAPSHRHPAQLEDVLVALEWAAERMAGLGQDPALLAVGGDSAGATLAACAALLWRDHGRYLAAQVLAYPPLDPACSAPSSHAGPGRFPDPHTMRAAWAAYLGPSGPAAGAAPGVLRTPLEASSLGRVAPAILGVGDRDPVSDDVSAYAGALRAAGVPVIHRIFRGMPHGAFLAPTSHPSVDGAPSMRAWLAGSLGCLLDSPHDPPAPAGTT